MEDAIFLTNEPNKWIVEYHASPEDTDETLKKFPKLKILHCGNNENFTEEGILKLKLKDVDCEDDEHEERIYDLMNAIMSLKMYEACIKAKSNTVTFL